MCAFDFSIPVMKCFLLEAVVLHSLKQNCTPDFSNAVFLLSPAGRDLNDILVQKYKIILDS